MNTKRKAIFDRIKHFEEGIVKAREYLEGGKCADWHGFRPLFSVKVKGGKVMPPHKDWVKNVFLPRQEKALKHAQKVLKKLD